MKLSEIVDVFISGDWGNESLTSEAPHAVSCVRGADIVPISNNEFENIPLRYISERSFQKKLLQVGDIVIEKSGGSPTQSTGRAVYISKELLAKSVNVVCSNFCVAFRVKNGWNSYFIYQYWQYLYNHGVFFNFEGKTSGIKNLQLDIALSTIEIEPYPIEKQIAIANSLKTFEDKIIINRSINHNLEAMAKQLYDYWFLQFNFPDENGKPYKSSGGKMVWNKKLKREIPEGWEVDIIQNIATTYSGGTPKSANKEYYKNGTIAWINSGELNSSIITQALNYITERGLNNSSAKLYPANTVLVAMYGATTGKVSLLTFEACSNQAVCGVIPNMKEMQHYVYLYLSSLYSHFINLSIGSARDNISQEIIKNMLLPIPSTDVILMFENKVKHVYKVIIEKKKQINTLTKLRDELLPLLMNGQASLQNCD